MHWQRHRDLWLRRTGLSNCWVGNVAYFVVAGSARYGTSRLADQVNLHSKLCGSLYRSIPGFPKEQKIKILLSWRLPRLDLDMLQLCAACNNGLATNKLLQFLGKNIHRYTGCGNGSSANMVDLENHPMHLASVLGHTDVLSVLVSRMPEMAGRTGQVTLQVDSSCCPEVPLCPLFPGSVDRGTPCHLAATSGHLDCLATTLKRLLSLLASGTDISAGIIEGVWDSLRNLYVRKEGMTGLMTVTSLTPQYCLRDFFLLACQLFSSCNLSSVQGYGLESYLLYYLVQNCAGSLEDTDFFHTMAQHLTRAQLESLLAVAVRGEINMGMIRPRRDNSAVLEFESVLYTIPPSVSQRLLSVCGMELQRTLEADCALTAQKCFGDPRRVRELVPDGLRFHFQVPFQDLHSHLSKGT